MTCTLCKKQPAIPGYKRCGWCRAQQNRAQRRYYAKANALYPEPVRIDALRLLSMFVLTSRELARALDISTNHASCILHRLWEQGRCERWPYQERMYRYQLREA